MINQSLPAFCLPALLYPSLSPMLPSFPPSLHSFSVFMCVYVNSSMYLLAAVDKCMVMDVCRTHSSVAMCLFLGVSHGHGAPNSHVFMTLYYWPYKEIYVVPIFFSIFWFRISAGSSVHPLNSRRTRSLQSFLFRSLLLEKLPMRREACF